MTGSSEIRRRYTESPEIDAMVVIEQAMERLDGDERKRVIEWANERWVGGVLDRMIARNKENSEGFSSATDAFGRHMEAIRSVCRELGQQSPADVYRAANYILDKAKELRREEEETAVET